MKKIFLAAIFALTILIPAKNCAAADIWVDSRNDEGVDIYVVDETIKNISADDNRAFSVSVKEVRGEQLLKNIRWTFIKFGDEFWRYQTTDMDGEHLTVVIPRNAIFEFCIEKLGLSYSAVENWYY